MLGEFLPSPAERIGHVGLSTPDLDRSIDFYRNALNMRPRRQPETISPADSRADVFAALFGAEWRGCRMVTLIGGRGPDLELFEFVGVGEPQRRDSPAWWSAGPFHIAFECDDVAAAADRFEAAGGRLCSAIQQTPRYRLVYALDPFGTVIELQQALNV